MYFTYIQHTHLEHTTSLNQCRLSLTQCQFYKHLCHIAILTFSCIIKVVIFYYFINVIIHYTLHVPLDNITLNYIVLQI